MTGSIQVAQLTAEMILRLKPESFLDVGVGSGYWGSLFREYTDIWEGRTQRIQWKTQIDGVEMYAPYVQEHQLAIYKRIFIGNTYTLIDELHSYDFVWAFNILGCFDKPKGLGLIRKMQEKTGILLGVWQRLGETVPMESPNANPHEAHISSWSLQDFKDTGFSYYKLFEAPKGLQDVFVVYSEEDLKPFGFSLL
jgi:hypothetical protein